MPAADQVPSVDQLVTRLKRAEGQLRGVQRMIEGGEECKRVLAQLAAVKSAVDQVGLLLITDRLRSCVADGGTDCVESFDDALATFLRHATLSH